MESLGIRSMDDAWKKMCSFRGDDQKEYHHKMVRCVLDKGKDMASVKEWEEKKKHDREEYKKEKREMFAKAVACKEQVLDL